ncbi:hypothetical protein CLF_102632 [Clonorchis sinensis]|uniref:Uncharacterized protein n=1 Tax=Clonorchis sinensis TaxID=79923 RepID=G7Y894_CLOSI|nr:hypothetical protein CLF_102632 [Clonorchis sinensis]
MATLLPCEIPHLLRWPYAALRKACYLSPQIIGERNCGSYNHCTTSTWFLQLTMLMMMMKTAICRTHTVHATERAAPGRLMFQLLRHRTDLYRRNTLLIRLLKILRHHKGEIHLGSRCSSSGHRLYPLGTHVENHKEHQQGHNSPRVCGSTFLTATAMVIWVPPLAKPYFAGTHGHAYTVKRFRVLLYPGILQLAMKQRLCFLFPNCPMNGLLVLEAVVPRVVPDSSKPTHTGYGFETTVFEFPKRSQEMYRHCVTFPT